MSSHYVMQSWNPNRMLLYSMPELPDDLHDHWMFGRIFSKPPSLPIKVHIREGHEQGDLLPFFDHPPVVSRAFLEALIDAGVDNLDAYEVELCSMDGQVRYEGYVAINILGLVRGAGSGAVFRGSSRLIDASIDSLELNPEAVGELLMFRLAENFSTIMVHESVRQVIEARGFPHMVFREPADFLAL